MNFENPFGGMGDKVKKKVKNIAKVGALAVLGIMPMASGAAENKQAVKEPQKTEADSAREMINDDTKSYQQGNKEYYYSYFTGLNHEQIDSLISGADRELAKKEAIAKAGEETGGVDFLNNDQKEVLRILYPDQVKNDPTFKGRWIPPSDELVKKYLKGEFKTKDDLIKLNQQNKK